MRKSRGEPETRPESAAVPAEDAEPGEAVEERPGEAVAEAAPEEASDYHDRWLRAEAELQNYRRRSQRDLEEAVRFAEERQLVELISILDDLERAIDAGSGEGAPADWMAGVQLVANRMRDHLSRFGVVKMEPLGQPFDPEFHEAMLEVDPGPDQTPGSVVQVVRSGYLRNRRALRPARVIVAGHGTR